jgi:hypothetical protein
MTDSMMTRILNLVAQALTGIATGNYTYASNMLRKAAGQLDEA